MGVLVFGDIMLDKYIDGTVTRISPEAPVPVVQVKNIYREIGGCGNVSNGVQTLQVNNELVALIGKDEHGKELRAILKEKKINARLMEQALPTVTKIRIVSNKHQLLRYDYEEVAEPAKIIQDKIKKIIAQSTASVAIISDYGKGACTAELCSFIIKSFNKRKKVVLVDPKTKDWTKYKGAYLISPNFTEFCEAVGTTLKNEDEVIATEAKKLMEKYQIDNILVTRSSKGMSLINKQKVLHIPANAKEVYDVTGAGDTVIATIAAMLSKKKTLEEAVLLANKAAAIAIAHFGTYAVSKKELFSS